MKTSVVRRTLVVGLVVLLVTLTLSGCQRREPDPVIGSREDYSHRIAVGGGHSLAVIEGGQVVAWTNPHLAKGNSYGQIVVPQGLRGVVGVAAGEEYSLALREDGEIVVWGRIEEPSEKQDFTAIAAGQQHGLALRQDGTVFAWGGSNQRGELDVPDGLVDVTSIAAGGWYSLAVTASGDVVAWGDNSLGQCNVPQQARNVVQVTAGWGHALALTSEGKVIAWGDDTYRQLQVPVEVQGKTHSVIAGAWHSFAILQDGSVVAWGGHPHRNTELKPQLLPTSLKPIMGLAVEEGYVLAVNADGGVQSWTYASGMSNVRPDGIVPTGLKVVGSSLHTVLGETKVTPKLAASSHSRAVLRADGTVVSWGLLHNVGVPENLSDVVDVAMEQGYAGGYTMAVTRNGEVVVWGRGVEAPGAIGATGWLVSVPKDLPKVTAVAGGRLGAIALQEDGTVVEWTFLFVSAGTTAHASPTAVVVPGLTDIFQIAAGEEHFLALRRDGNVFAWGSNEYGQATVPGGGDKYKSIAAWENVSLAIREDGTLAAWGDNRSGQLDFPADLNDVLDVAGTLALKSDGTVVTWGRYAHLVPEIQNVIAISPWMALLSDGTIVSWSYHNAFGEDNPPAGLRVK